MSDGRQTGSGEGGDLLAAEYALGVLEGEALNAALSRLSADPAFAAAVEAWSLRLAPLAEALSPVSPPDGLKARIEATLFGAPQPEPGAGLWSSLAFWRGAAAVFAATTLFAALSWLATDAGSPEPAEAYYAALQADPAAPSVLVRFDPGARRLSIAGPLDAPAGEPVQPELWVIPPGGAPQSLGLIAGLDGPLAGALEVDPETAAAIAQGATLAISLEPPGGSPTGAPTGPVVAAGAVRAL